MVEDVAILFGLSLIYLAMVGMIITLARIFSDEEHAPGSDPPTPNRA